MENKDLTVRNYFDEILDRAMAGIEVVEIKAD